MRENLDDEITEVKSENAIDRITSQANPRTLERVPAGARFKVRMVLDVLCEEDKALAARVLEGLRLLEDDALGGGGSRGSGRVRFANLKLAWRNRAFYSSGGAEAELASGADLGAVQASVNNATVREKLIAVEHDLRSSHPAAAHRAVAHRSRFGRSRSRGSHLSQRFAVLRRVHGAWRGWAVGLVAGRDRARTRSRPCASAPAFRSCGDTLFVVPRRRTSWPPPPSSKVRWKGARFVPLSVVENLLHGRVGA